MALPQNSISSQSKIIFENEQSDTLAEALNNQYRWAEEQKLTWSLYSDSNKSLTCFSEVPSAPLLCSINLISNWRNHEDRI